MAEIINFVLANAESIVSYEISYYHLDNCYVVEFTMRDGKKVQINY